MDNSSDVIDMVSGNGGEDSRNDSPTSTSSAASSPRAIASGYRLFDRQDSLHQLMGGGKGFFYSNLILSLIARFQLAKVFLFEFDPFFDCKISIGFSRMDAEGY